MDMVRRHYFNSQHDAVMPEEFGFNYPDNITETWNMVVVLESFQKWPEEGGYLDQDAKLIDDILMLKNIKDHVRDQNKPKGDGK